LENDFKKKEKGVNSAWAKTGLRLWLPGADGFIPSLLKANLIFLLSTKNSGY
jgi:hypothetical protein